MSQLISFGKEGHRERYACAPALQLYVPIWKEARMKPARSDDKHEKSSVIMVGHDAQIESRRAAGLKVFTVYRVLRLMLRNLLDANSAS